MARFLHRKMYGMILVWHKTCMGRRGAETWHVFCITATVQRSHPLYDIHAYYMLLLLIHTH